MADLCSGVADGYIILGALLLALSASCLGSAATANVFVGFPYLALLVYLCRQPQLNRGHRAGAEGYSGPTCENTIEALTALIESDHASKGLQCFPYVEVDIQETKDGRLVVLHDAALHRGFPPTGPNIPAIQLLQEQGIAYDTATIQDVTASQLRSLHLGGRPGRHAPTLQEFLAACISCDLHRPLVLEVKCLVSDQGRAAFLECIRSYKQHALVQAQRRPHLSHAPFGHFGVIAFPHLFAASFGEFGDLQWLGWASQLRAEGVAVRSCCCHFLSLIHGA
ncbi:MAG: hypothetical protein WDW36_006030 [Sanguina aurantia]